MPSDVKALLDQLAPVPDSAVDVGSIRRRARDRNRRLFAGATLGAAVLIGLAVLGVNVLAPDGDREDPSQHVIPNAASPAEAELFRFAAQHLPDRTLETVAPTGFRVYEIHRYGRERHDGDWITVGAQMEGPVPFARAIFYVHPNSAAAREMYERQVELTDRGPSRSFTDRGPSRSFQVPGVAGSLCGVREDSLYWCHAVKGRVYLLIQSSAGRSGTRTVDPSTKDAAVALTTAFGSFLQNEAPESGPPSPLSDVGETNEDSVVSIIPEQARVGDEVELTIHRPPGTYGLRWVLERLEGSSWQFFGNLVVGPGKPWEEERFFLPPNVEGSVEAIGFTEPASITIEIPELEAGKYRLLADFVKAGRGSVEKRTETHAAEFEVVE